MINLDDYYENMPTRQIMQEFRELVAEWRTGRADGQVCNALSAIWRTMKHKYNTDIGVCEDYGNARELGYW